MKSIAMALMLILIASSICSGVEPAPRITDREIVERLTKLEEGQKAILREMDNRFESIDNRFESIDKRFDQLINVLIAIISAFAGIVTVTIGFAIWDRRTMIRPFETKVRSMERHLEEVAGRAKSFDEDKVNRILGAMKKLAVQNTEVADALRSFNLL